MLRKACVLAALVSFLAGCQETGNSDSPGSPDPAHNSRNSLDWAGTYRGTIPCADCEGIELTISLSYDGSFSRSQEYLGKGLLPFRDSGQFSWNASGNTVFLPAENGDRLQFQVGENRLFFLDRNGQRITGDLAGRYILSRVNP